MLRYAWKYALLYAIYTISLWAYIYGAIGLYITIGLYNSVYTVLR